MDNEFLMEVSAPEYSLLRPVSRCARKILCLRRRSPSQSAHGFHDGRKHSYYSYSYSSICLIYVSICITEENDRRNESE